MMKMKRAVIVRLSFLISLVLLVKCDDVGTLNVDDEYDFSTVGSSDEKDIDTGFATDAKKLVGKGGADNETKCLVCMAVIEVMYLKVGKEDTRQRIKVTSTKSIQYAKSETHLVELMEDLCENMDTLAIIRQVLIQKTVRKNMLNNGGAVEDTSGFDPESLSPKQLNYFCAQILEENDESISQEFMKEVLSNDIDEIVCTQMAKYCDEDDTQVDNERDEL